VHTDFVIVLELVPLYGGPDFLKLVRSHGSLAPVAGVGVHVEAFVDDSPALLEGTQRVTLLALVHVCELEVHIHEFRVDVGRRSCVVAREEWLDLGQFHAPEGLDAGAFSRPEDPESLFEVVVEVHDGPDVVVHSVLVVPSQVAPVVLPAVVLDVFAFLRCLFRVQLLLDLEILPVVSVCKHLWILELPVLLEHPQFVLGL